MNQKQYFISEWTKGLEENAECQLHAMGLLDDAIDPQAMENPIPNFPDAHAAKRSKRTWWLFCLAVVAVISTLVVAGMWGRHYSLIRFMFLPLKLFTNSPPKISTSSTQAELILYGNPNRSGKAAQMRALWESEPKNPAYYADYSREYLNEHGKLPNDFLTVAAEIDPDNGWFPYLAACVVAQGATKNTRIEHPRSPIKLKDLRKESYEVRQKLRRKIVHSFDILDSTKVQNSLDLWRQSLKMKKFDSYEDEMHQLRYPYLCEANTLLDRYQAMIYLAYQPVSTMHQFHFSAIVAAELQRGDLSAEDCEIFLLDIERHIDRTYSELPTNVVKELLNNAFLNLSHAQIQIIKPDGVDAQLLQRFQKRLAALEIRRDELSKKSESARVSMKPPRNASAFSEMSIFTQQMYCLKDIPLSEEDLKPMNQVEHVFLMQILACVTMLFLLLLLPYTLWFRRHTPIHGLAQQAWLALPFRDIIKLACWSVFLPLGYFILIYSLTPLAGKELGVSDVNPAIPVASLILMMIALPRLLVHQYTSAWENMAGRKKTRSLFLGWGFMIVALVPMHTFPLMHQAIVNLDLWNVVLAICFAPLVCWLLWNGGRGCFSRDPYMRIMHSLRRRVLAFISISAVLLLFLCGFVLRYVESRSIQMDRTLAIPAEVASPTVHESKIATAMHEEMKNLLESAVGTK